MSVLKIKPEIQELRCLSQLLTNSAFRKIIREGNSDTYRRRIRKYSHLFNNYEKKTNASLLVGIFDALTQQYRNEYIYKSALVNQVLLREYRMDSTAALFEFKIGRSIADMLLINGKARLFEIKTELDNPDRLRGQISDYQKAVSNITVVTYESLADKYLNLIKDTNVGLIILTSQNQIRIIKETTDYAQLLDHETLFKMLHKVEYSNIVMKYFGEIPTVPNTLYFSTCLRLIRRIEIDIFQRFVFEEIKKRKVPQTELIESDLTPNELKTICLALNFDVKEIKYLHKFLNRPFSNS